MVRGVAQLGSAPALGAGGRPFKSARPDRASSSGGQSNGLLSRGSGVRVPSGAPRDRQPDRIKTWPVGFNESRMVSVAQLAEHRVVAPAVEGSNHFTPPHNPSA